MTKADYQELAKTVRNHYDIRKNIPAESLVILVLIRDMMKHFKKDKQFNRKEFEKEALGFGDLPWVKKVHDNFLTEDRP